MRLAASLAIAAVLIPALARAGEKSVPPYRVPAAFTSEAKTVGDLVARTVRAVAAERALESEEGWRILASLGRPAMPEVVRALPRASWFGRSLLMEAIAESGVPEVEPVLVQGARDPSWAVRRMAARGLGRASCRDPEEALLALGRDPSWRVRLAAGESLRRQVSRGRCSRAPAVEALLRLAEDPDRDVRHTALFELGLLRAVEAKDLFVAGYSEDDEELREICFEALLGLEGAREDLIRALESVLEESDETTFLKAALKYAELTGPRILEEHGRKLEQALLGGDSRLTAKIYVEIGRPAVPVLLEILRSTYRRPSRVPVRGNLSRVVLDIVQKVLKEDAAPLLAEILTEWEEALPPRRYAAELGRRFHARALVPIFRRLYWENRFTDLRVTFLQGIAAAGAEDLEKYLEHAITKGGYHLRRAADKILSKRRDIDLSWALEQAIERERADPEIVKLFLRLLHLRKAPGLFTACERLLADPDPEFRGAGAAWMAGVPDPDRVLPALLAALEREDGRRWGADDAAEEEEFPELTPEMRRRTIQAILHGARVSSGPRSLPLLARVVRDADPIVREYALVELRKLGDPRAVPLALDLLSREQEEQPLKEAWRLVVASDRPEAAAKVREVLDGEADLPRLVVLSALSEVEGARLPRVLLEALATGLWESETRVLAVEAVTARGGPEHLALLSHLATGDPSAEIRGEAVRALGELGLEEAVPTLLGLLPENPAGLPELNVEERLLAREAIEALGYLGSGEAVPTLLALLKAEWPLALGDATDDRQHFEAANLLTTALGRIGDVRALPDLLELLFTPEFHRSYSLLDRAPPEGQRSLVGTLLQSLVRFPDAALTETARARILALRESGAVYAVDERYLLHVAKLLADPLRGSLGRPQPRPRLAAELLALVLVIAPRESAADLEARAWLSEQCAEQGRFADAVAQEASALDLRQVLDPWTYDERSDFFLARADLLEGMALMVEGKTESGWRRYSAGLARDPDDPFILNLYAWWLTRTGRRLPDALRAAMAAGRRAASDPAVLDTLGWTLHRMGHHLEAVHVLYVAVKLEEERAGREEEPPDSGIIYRYAAAAARAGLLEEAEDDLFDAVRRNDNLAEAARASPDFEALRERGRLEPAIEEALRTIPR